MHNYDNILHEYIKTIDKKLDDYLQASDAPASIAEAMLYSIFPGGKRIRPVFMLAVAEMLGGKAACDAALPFACALEMIHTYSLIHDDLPAMDNDDMRRGRPANHVANGEAMAILAGDGLLNMAFEIMADYCATVNTSESVQAMSKVAKYSGISGMIGGQVMDIKLENATNVSETEVEYVYTNKTSKLFMAAFGSGALVGGAENSVNVMEDIGHKLGMAFQIKDDLLDISGTKVFGKPIGSDDKNNKSTYISVLGEPRAKEIYANLSSQALESIKTFKNSEFLAALAESLVNRTW